MSRGFPSMTRPARIAGRRRVSKPGQDFRVARRARANRTRGRWASPGRTDRRTDWRTDWRPGRRVGRAAQEPRRRHAGWNTQRRAWRADRSLQAERPGRDGRVLGRDRAEPTRHAATVGTSDWPRGAGHLVQADRIVPARAAGPAFARTPRRGG